MINPAIDFGDEYAFGEDVNYKTPEIKHNIRPQGNQWENKETKTACTIVWAVNQIIRLFWIDLNKAKTNQLYIEVIKYCEKYWYVIGDWWGTPTACNIVCKRWNEIWYKAFNKEKVFRLRLYWNNPKLIEALDKGHLVWYTKQVNFGMDQVEWLIRRDKYPKMVWHRLNRKGIKYTIATWGADVSKAERGALDNYHGAIGESFAFKEVKKYINNWVYAYWYVIMPESCMENNIEKEKQKIARLKAINAVIGALTSTYEDLNTEEQLMASSLAWEMRNTEGARERINWKENKVYQSVCDLLSFAWKYADEETQKKYSELASYLREKYKLK